ncbi:hypothetical protein [Streptomyces sp. 2231.1]|uniref:hypothetical protein n=1 Tax=Streptomyces sp. 2231.1 TaxID=1855347 RepID=UPI00210EE7BC|nr:hypothetical protein [Streptomyces sp. 2231.1]
MKILLDEAGLSPARLARALRLLAAEQHLSLTCDHTTVRRWLAGTRPRPPAPALLLECLSRQLGRPVAAHDAGLTNSPATVVDSSWQADPLHKLNQIAYAELDPARYVLLGSEVFSLASLILPEHTMPYHPPRRQEDSQPDGPCLRLSEVEHMKGLMALFYKSAEQYGGQRIRIALAAYLAHEVVPLLHSLTREGVHRRLLSAAAQLTFLQGTLCADSGLDRTAQHYYQIAAQMAAEAEDAASYVIALRTMANQAHELGHHTAAVLNLSEHAAAHATQCSPAVRAYTQAGLAVVQAYHDRNAALAALTHAEKLHTWSDSSSAPFTAYPIGALHYQRAQTLIALGSTSSAITALAASLRLRTAAEHRASALTRARLAETHLRLGHLEEAMYHWEAYLNIYPALRSARAMRCLQTMRRQLHAYRQHHRVRELLSKASREASS